MNIDLVYFDLGNVLVSFDHDIACRNFAELTGISFDKSRYLLFEEHADQPGLQMRYEAGEITSDQFFQAIKELAPEQREWTKEELLVAISDMFTPIESMAETVRRVRESGPRIGVLSNTCSAHWQFVRRQPWRVSMIDFDLKVLSYEAKSIKPDSLIYEVAEEAAGIPTHRILFLDDKPENVEAARARGWNAEQCIGGRSAERALHKYFPAMVQNA
ncbi:MAG: HAD family phosphatase [Planctomycetota bacterium]